MNAAVVQKHLAEATIAKVKRLVTRREGEGGIKYIAASFGIVEEDAVQPISKDAFTAGLAGFGIQLSADEVRAIWSYFDRNGDGVLSITEFMTALRGGLNPQRRALVSRAFDIFDKDGDGKVPLDDLRGRYNCAAHPAVIRGESSQDEEMAAFSAAFNERTNPTGLVSRQDFEQFCAGVSATIDDDDYFAAIMRACWSIPGAREDVSSALGLQCEGGQLAREASRTAAGPARSTRAFTTYQPVEDREEIARAMARKDAFQRLIASHRAVMLQHKMGFRGVGRLLRQRDVSGEQYLSLEDFLDCLWQNRLYVEDKSLLSFLDTNRDGTVDCSLYMAHIMGELPPARQLLLERLWKRLPTDSRGRTDLAVVQRAYMAPDGVSLNTFLDAWDARLVPDGKVGFVELLEWIIPVSARITSDTVFEKTVRETWRGL